jgi:hypothetical protein
MTALIGDTNGFKPLSALRKAAKHPAVEEIEGGGMDDGRVFLHLRDGFTFDGEGRSIGVGDALEVQQALASIEAAA